MVIQICLNTMMKGTNGYWLPFHAPEEGEEGNRKQFLASWLLKRFTYGAVAAVISKKTVLKVVPGRRHVLRLLPSDFGKSFCKTMIRITAHFKIICTII